LAKHNGSPLTLTAAKVDKYTPFIQLLSRRELEVIEAVLAGNVRHKQLSAVLNISFSTVKTHLIHIYQTTGVSSIAVLSSLFHGYTPPAPKNQPQINPKDDINKYTAPDIFFISECSMIRTHDLLKNVLIDIEKGKIIL
jgi:DNA-binding CsgD family transcriptional regulator